MNTNKFPTFGDGEQGPQTIVIEIVHPIANIRTLVKFDAETDNFLVRVYEIRFDPFYNLTLEKYEFSIYEITGIDIATDMSAKPQTSVVLELHDKTFTIPTNSTAMALYAMAWFEMILILKGIKL